MPEKNTPKVPQRVLTIHDEKQQDISFSEYRYAMPGTQWDQEPVRYYKANLQWASIIEGLLTWLATPTAWQGANEDNHDAIRQIGEYLKGIEIPTGEFPEIVEPDCLAYPSNSIFIGWYPMNPFTNAGYVPDGYITSPFVLYDGTPSLPPQYLLGDVYVPLNAITLNPINLFTGDLPQITLNVKGSGQIEADFIKFPTGGMVVETINNPPDFGDIIAGIFTDQAQFFELTADIISFPPEESWLSKREINIEAAPDEITTVYWTFFPMIDDSLIPIRFGGGLRSIQLCGFETDSTDDLIPEGYILVSTSELEDAFCNCLDSWTVRVASTLAAGLNSGIQFTVNQDGEVVVAGGTGGTPTSIAAQEALSGSALNAAKEVRDYLEAFQDFYDSGDTLAFIETKIELLYLVDQATTAISNYDSYRQFPNGRIAAIDVDLLAEKFYCEGIDKPNIIEYIIEDYEFGVDQAQLFDFIAILQQEQLDIWSNDGTDNPNSDYLGFDCYRRPNFEFDIPASLIAEEAPTKHFVTTGLYFGITTARNIRFTVTGKYTAPSGEEFDLLYWKDDQGVLAQQGWQVFGFAQNNGDFEISMQPPIQLPYSATGVYSWIATMPSNNYTTFAWRVPNFPTGWQDAVTGNIHVLIEDAGQAI